MQTLSIPAGVVIAVRRSPTARPSRRQRMAKPNEFSTPFDVTIVGPAAKLRPFTELPSTRRVFKASTSGPGHVCVTLGVHQHALINASPAPDLGGRGLPRSYLVALSGGDIWCPERVRRYVPARTQRADRLKARSVLK